MNGRAVLADGAPEKFAKNMRLYEKYKNFQIKAGGDEGIVCTRSLDRPARPVFLRPRTDVRGRFEGKRGAPHGGLPLCLQPWHTLTLAGGPNEKN